jgi:DNA polymerase-1
VSLILVDGSALIYRSFYAFASRPLTAPTGEITSVAFGFCNALLRLIQDYRPAYLAVVFDLKGPTFRHVMYPAYKSNRKPMPDELAAQLPRLRELLGAWGLAVLDREGYEADDVMATIAVRSAGVVQKAWHYTGDKDFMQLLDARVGMLKPGRRGDEIAPFTVDDVEREYGLSPRTLIDVFALSGDKSDNIPGALGIGDRTALKLIRDFGSLDALYAGLAASSLTPRIKRVLTDNREQVLLSRRLFEIDCDVPVVIDWDLMRTVLPVAPAIVSLLDALGLHRVQSWAGRLQREFAHQAAVRRTAPAALDLPPPPTEPDPPAEAPPPPTEPETAGDPLARRGYVLLKFDADLAAWLEGLPADEPLCVDTETDSLDVAHARLVGISLAAHGRPAAYIPVLRREAGPDPAVGVTGSLFAVGDEVDALPAVRMRLAPVLADPRRLKVGQNLKYDEWILGRHGLPLGGPRFDTMLASYVLDPGRRSHGMDELATIFLGERTIHYDELFARGDRRKDILAVPLARLAEYAAEDADVTLRLYQTLAPMLQEEGLAGLFHDLEMPLSAVLLRMERSGIKIDRAFLSELGATFAAELTLLEKRIHDCAGEVFNVQSSQQLAQILFVKLKLKPLKKTTTGWSTDVSVLSQLAEEHELPQLILDYRQVAKLQNTYVETLPAWADAGTDLVHTSYSQAVAATGRLSCNDPNLQNIPIRTELGRQIRRAFIPRAPGHVFLSADYSQIELRLLAHLSGDAALRSAFREGVDVHRRTAALIAGVSEPEVTSDQRSRAKAINFGVIYGMGARALAKQIKVSQTQAKQFIDRYFATYPGVRSFIDETTAKARQDGYVETMLGRRRLLPELHSTNPGLRSFQERIAVNTPIQGTAADLIKLAMLRLDKVLRETGSPALMLLQVHDELVLEVAAAEVAAVTLLVREAMEQALPLAVPLVVDVHTGRNWAEAHG